MIRIELAPSEGGWRVSVDYGTQGYTEHFKLKWFAQLFAIRRAKELHEQGARTVSLKIKGKNGRYQEERTYGPDPARTPG